jgi:hypothetical protein
MNIRLGIYDIFSTIIPGGFYLVAIAEFTRLVGWVKFDWRSLQDIGILPSLALVSVAYIIGSATDRIGSYWHRIFKKREASNRALDRFKELHSNRWIIDFDDRDWPILRTYLHIHNPNVADAADRFTALSIMLRNISLGFFLLALIEIIPLATKGNWAIVALSILLLFLSYQTAIRARTLRDWSYSSVLEAIIAHRVNLEERVKPVKASSKRRSEK